MGFCSRVLLLWAQLGVWHTILSCTMVLFGGSTINRGSKGSSDVLFCFIVHVIATKQGVVYAFCVWLFLLAKIKKKDNLMRINRVFRGLLELLGLFG